MSNLITLAEYKAYTGIASTNQDSVINIIIGSVSQLVKTHCGRTFVDYVTTPKEEVFSGGVPSFFLKESPIIAIQDIDYSTDLGRTYNSLVEFEDYVINLETDTIDVVPLSNFPYGKNAYKVTYLAGYTTLPEDLKIATMDLVTYYLKSDSAVKSTRSPGSNTTQIEYVLNSTLPSHIRRVLDMYRLDL